MLPPALREEASGAARELVVLYRCTNRYHHIRNGTWVVCVNLQPRPGGECWACRQTDWHPFTYPEKL